MALMLLLLLGAWQSVSAQERRPVDSQHPLWLIHVDVWNTADPQKIIDLIPDDVKPYVCMNLSLSCSYDTEKNVYKMPRSAVRTYRSWASVCQHNGLWFTCQPASGGHTHIQDDDLETFEYFFKTYPNFLGWNYAEQFWGFDESNDESSSSQSSRIALFAKLVPMHHKYGGFLTVSFCGNIWSHPLNPIGMMKRNKDLMQACKDYPEAILWLFKYTTSSCWYNNESVTFGPFVSGLAKNYGVRYDNCGWNGALDAILGENHGKKYPGAAGLGTVMEQTCVNGGAVWDGPELIWTEDFQNLSNTSDGSYTRRNWGTFGNFQGVWLDMFRKVVDGTMYIPTRQEVVGNIKIAIKNDVSSGSDEDKYATWGDLYDGLYKQTDPFNRGNGQWMNNFCYMKKTGRYGTIPMVTGFYDETANAIPVKVNKSARSSRWGTQAKKVADFNEQYPEVSEGDLYVNRYRNQLVTYTPYTYLNSKLTASAAIPLKYNTCDSLKLTWNKLSAGYIREYADSILFYLNNYRSDTTTQRIDKIIVTGCKEKPTYSLSKHKDATTGKVLTNWKEETGTYTLSIYHFGGIDLVLHCSGQAVDRLSDVLPADALPMPKQPLAFRGPVVIEAEDMDYKSIKGLSLTNAGYYYPEMKDFAGNGYVEMGTNTAGALRHYLTLQEGGDYDIYVRYCDTGKSGTMTAKVNTPTAIPVAIEPTAVNEWRKARFSATLKEGKNTFILTNTDGISMKIDQIVYVPAGTSAEKFQVCVRAADHGTVVAAADSVAEGQTVRLTVTPEAGYALKELRVVNSVFYTQGKTIPFEEGATEVTFTMPDENVTIRPVFYDTTQSYLLDYTNTLSGTLPEGWRTTDGSEVRDYPYTATSGPRTFAGLTGYQGKALYWRTTSAEYGRLSAYRLTLEPGSYQLVFAMAAWKGSPTYQANILNSTGSTIATSSTFTAAPNLNGNYSGNISSAKRNTLDFDVTAQGNYIIQFKEMGSGMQEFLLAECVLRNLSSVNGITTVQTARQLPQGIYSPAGIRRQSLQRGLNIIVGADGHSRKVMVQ